MEEANPSIADGRSAYGALQHPYDKAAKPAHRDGTCHVASHVAMTTSKRLICTGRTRGSQSSFARTVLGNLRKMSTDRGQRSLFFLAMSTIVLAIGSISYASLSSCLGALASSLFVSLGLTFDAKVLVSSSIQLIFRGVGFLVVLNSQVLNREKASLSFSYGYVRSSSW